MSNGWPVNQHPIGAAVDNFVDNKDRSGRFQPYVATEFFNKFMAACVLVRPSKFSNPSVTANFL